MNATMNDERALATLQALANGADPLTGTSFPAGSPYQHPDTRVGCSGDRRRLS